jgi:hypothetical protein
MAEIFTYDLLKNDGIERACKPHEGYKKYTQMSYC